MLNFSRFDKALAFAETVQFRSLVIVSIANVLLGMGITALFAVTLSYYFYVLFALLLLTLLVVIVNSCLEFGEALEG